MYKRTTCILCDEVYKPYLSYNGGEARIELNEFKCPESDVLKECFDQDKFLRYRTLPHKTRLAQSCDFDRNEYLKDRGKQSISKWHLDIHAESIATNAKMFYFGCMICAKNLQ